jgi:hypothetical protein
MALITNTYETYTTIGIREDISDVVHNIDPIDTPFMSSVGRDSAIAVKHEWQTDNLDAVGYNAQPEGQIAAFPVITPTVRPNNYMQISEKTVAVTGTNEVVSKWGRSSEMGYQLARLSKSLKRDMEYTLTRNQVINAGASGTARKTASYEDWITGATASRGGAGPAGADPTISDGTPTTGPVDGGSTRPLLESYLKVVIQNVWNNGGEPTLIICGPFNKTVISSFSGNSTRFDQGEDKILTAAIDIYRSDFGDHRIVPNRFSRERSVLVISPSLVCVTYLRSFRSIPLAVTGDNTQRLLNVEYGLTMKQRAGCGVVADLNES